MLERITKIIREYKDDETLEVAADTTFEELELDSLDTVELGMNLEEEFDVTIEMSKDMKTVGDLIDAIEKAE